MNKVSSQNHTTVYFLKGRLCGQLLGNYLKRKPENMYYVSIEL